MGKRKYRIRWDRVFLMLVCPVLLMCLAVTCVYHAAVGVSSLFSDKEAAKSDTVAVRKLSEEMALEDNMMTARIDSFMSLPMRLDHDDIAVSVYDVTTGRYVYEFNERKLLPPASCMKIPTAVAAIKTLGLNHRYHESLLVRGEIRRDTLVGTLLLRADDDPLLEDFHGLVRQMRNRGIRHVRGNVMVTLAMEDTLEQHPTAKKWDIPYNKTPLLLKGKAYVMRNLVQSLRMGGVTFRRDASVRPTGKYHYVASSSHPMRNALVPMLTNSSNVRAEAVFYHLDYKSGLRPKRRIEWVRPHAVETFFRETFRDDSTHMMKGFVINDGSGLSPSNRLNARFLVEVLKYAREDRQMYEFFRYEAFATPCDGLRRGSLLSRLSRQELHGKIFVKTGTIVTVGASSLAGYLEGVDGHEYIFSIINANSPVAEARMFQDRLCRLMITGKTR
ncbi:MAG: D-alanyl-D-alanine carboxypeptidase [Bacteroidales bacterium]|nr:D-alanyl-D-alanine carboxypeptidase [Bacteroidales bacterium]MCM1148044.1 D-alanyl-D-alanine carboxypeptidase [Bacteroidales bacterium]MCM1206861.1 D-alanyl-D-alanine carboxypeptidase [Bacillota bacterium]MCM1510998.1 D-alanyl-D-alanine carboxypeptidase [Clostridium sp.]